MGDFTKSENTATNSKDVVFELYQKSVKKGAEITLGTNGQSSNCVNYAVFATEAGKSISGDVNADGIVDVQDVKALQNWLHKKGSLKNSKSADMNADGIVNVCDLALLKKAILNASV